MMKPLSEYTDEELDARFHHLCSEGKWDGLRAVQEEIAYRRNRRREADRVDGYDRDDLGESPDY